MAAVQMAYRATYNRSTGVAECQVDVEHLTTDTAASVLAAANAHMQSRATRTGKTATWVSTGAPVTTGTTTRRTTVTYTRPL